MPKKTLSLLEIRGIAEKLEGEATIKPRCITMDEARAHNASLDRNGLGLKHPGWYLLAGTPCYVLEHPRRRRHCRK